MDKKGVIGSFIVLFVATVFIIMILIGFVFMSYAVKSFSEAKSGLVIHKESKVGISDGVGYMKNYFGFVELRRRISAGAFLNDAISEVGYEE